MKQILQQYAAYTIWADQRIFETVNNLSDDRIDREIASSFPSIKKTILHIWDAESIWWQRLKLSEKITRPSEEFKGSFAGLLKNLEQQSVAWKEWIDNANENQLQHVFAYQDSRKEQFKQPVYEMLLHLFNHSTYHRGQLVTLLRQLGVEKIPATDFIVFCRKK